MEILLTIVADLFVTGFIGLSQHVYKWIIGDASKSAFKEALRNAIYQYELSSDKGVVAPLLKKDGLLTNDQVLAELRMIVSFHREPNYNLIGNIWKDMLDYTPPRLDIEGEARRFVSLLKAYLRSSDIYRAVIDSQDIQKIAELTGDASKSIEHIEHNTEHLARLLEDNLVPLYQHFSKSKEDIRKSIFLDFKNYIYLKTDSFVGRNHVLQRLTQFITSPELTNGYFFLQGDPGIGKSAVLAKFVVQHGCIHHFNIRSEINTSRAFLKNICAQLIAAYGLDYVSLPEHVAEDGTVFHNILLEISSKIQTGSNRCVIVIDALDEVEQKEIEGSANPLYLPQTPPRGIFFIVSRRRDNQPFVRISDTPVFYYTISQDEVADINDIRLFLEYSVKHPNIQKYIDTQKQLDPNQFIEIFLGKSQGNFIYTRLVIDEIRKGTYDAHGVDNLPQGIENYYQDHWDRMRALGYQDWVDAKLPVILALTVAKEPINIEQISRYAGVEVTAPNKTTIRTVLNDFDQFIYTRIFTNPHRNDSTKERVYRWYHASFFDFVERKDEIEEGVSLARAKQRELEVMKTQMMRKYGRRKR